MGYHAVDWLCCTYEVNCKRYSYMYGNYVKKFSLCLVHHRGYQQICLPPHRQSLQNHSTRSFPPLQTVVVAPEFADEGPSGVAAEVVD
jgi:hypothetical protein